MTQPKQREEAEEPTKAKTAHKDKELTYSIAILREHCAQLFGVMPEVFDGALYGVKEDELTKKEVNQKIKAFLQREVP